MDESTGASHGSGYVKGCQCERCEAARRTSRERSQARPDKDRPGRRQYKTEKQRQYDQARREQRPLKPKLPKAAKKPANSARHGGPDEWARMYAEQDGLCYLCEQPLPVSGKDVHVDHDHTCCDIGPKSSQSCQYCRRGLAHQACNQIWGLARENPALLRLMADNGSRAAAEAKRRIAAKPAVQEVFGTDARGAVDEVYSQPMPDLDMPVGAAWPDAGESTLF